MHVKGHSLMHQWLTVVKSSPSIAQAGKEGLKARIDGPRGGLHKDTEGRIESRGKPLWQGSCVKRFVSL